MIIHDNSQLRYSHNWFSTNPTRDVRSDHRSVRQRPKTLSLDRPRPRFSVPCLNQLNNTTIHDRNIWSRWSRENGCICIVIRPQVHMVHPQARGRPLQSTPLTLGVLSPGGKSFSFSFSFSFCLVSMSIPWPSHDQISPARPHQHPRSSSLTAGPLLSLFLSFWYDFGRALPKDFRAIFCARDSIFIEKATPNCPEETGTSS